MTHAHRAEVFVKVTLRGEAGVTRDMLVRRMAGLLETEMTDASSPIAEYNMLHDENWENLTGKKVQA